MFSPPFCCAYALHVCRSTAAGAAAYVGLALASLETLGIVAIFVAALMRG